MIEILFYVFAGLAILGALSILWFSNVLYAAFGLVITFLSLAVLYVLAGAEFVAVTQVMVYVGGIVVLMVMGIMFTNKISGKALVTESHNKLFGFLSGFGVLAILLYSLYHMNKPLLHAMVSTDQNTIKSIGIGLMSDYMLPFEVAAILLLLALIGAATIASGKTVKED